MAAAMPEPPVLTGSDHHEARICEALVEQGRLKENDLNRARRLHEESGGSLVALLTRLGLASERDVAEAIARHGPAAEAGKDMPECRRRTQLPLRFLKQYHVAAVGETDTSVQL